jgi:predicted ribosomally synthesized peptide with SipW-like signal peptide
MRSGLALVALSACVLVVLSGFSGGLGTTALLSDSETAGGTIAVGNDTDRVTEVTARQPGGRQHSTTTASVASGPAVAAPVQNGTNATIDGGNVTGTNRSTTTETPDSGTVTDVNATTNATAGSGAGSNAGETNGTATNSTATAGQSTNGTTPAYEDSPAAETPTASA